MFDYSFLVTPTAKFSSSHRRFWALFIVLSQQALLLVVVVAHSSQSTLVEGFVISHYLSNSRATPVNTRVREIIQILLSYESSSSKLTNPDSFRKLGPEWSKAKNYFYNKKDLSPAQVGQVLHFLDKILPEDKDLVLSVVQSNPRILRKNVENYLKPTAEFLEGLYGSQIFYEAVRRNPGILLSSGVGYDAPNGAAVEDIFVSELGLKQREISMLKTKAPWLFQRSVEQINSVIGFCDNLLFSSEKTSVKRAAIIARLLKSYPTIFNLSVDTGLAPKVSFLEEKCGLTKVDIASLLMGSRASIFCLSVKKNLQPTMEILTQLLPSDPDQKMQYVRTCVLKHPQLLCLSRENLMAKISYFEAVDSMCGRKSRGGSLASRVAIRSPAVYSLSLKDNIIPKVAFLARVWGKQIPPETRVDALTVQYTETKADQGPEASLADLLGEYPTILTLSLEGNIQPTLNFYNRTGFINLDANWNWKSPDAERSATAKTTAPVIRARYIACSLFNRLLPRWHFYLTNKERVIIFSGTKARPNSPSLQLLAVANDKEFCAYLGADQEVYKTFKQEAIPRLKFSSQFDTWLKTGRPIDV